MPSSTVEKFRHECDVKQCYYHDIFNLLSLILIVIVDSHYLYNVAIGDENSSAKTTLVCVGSYMLLDSLYCLLIPSALPTNSPWLIITHHMITLAYSYFPWYHQEIYGVACATMAMVEVNTIFNILRRNAKPDTFERNLFENLFLISWLFFRIGVFPYMTYIICIEYYNYSLNVASTFINIHLMAVLCNLYLSLLGFHWTWLIYKKLDRKNDKNKKIA